jgi:hypothetical protein
MTIKEMNPFVWFGTRKVSPIPRHFVKAHTPATTESENWVLVNIKGRYGISNSSVDNDLDWKDYFFFEDPADAMIFELRWSGTK